MSAERKINGVIYFSETRSNGFEEIYLSLRKAESRVYDDDTVKHLPEVPPCHRYYYEWLVRKRSMKTLLKYLLKNEYIKEILEIGCGNGWLAANISLKTKRNVTGLDVNITELEQAARLFGNRENLTFAYGDVYMLDKKYDIIILPSVIAYFEDLQGLIKKLLGNLNANGEIHIIDSPFFDDKLSAKEKTFKYFKEMGFEEMAGQYFHHSLNDLKGFNQEVKYDPTTFIHKANRAFDRSTPPFYWVVLRK
ncbi:MAG: class I SAM-dependent methyltransferase [Ignavibacteria bacterium]|nr:class I SAM-dependent methyltransferase [Ignavibacteria bacterium]